MFRAAEQKEGGTKHTVTFNKILEGTELVPQHIDLDSGIESNISTLLIW
jgi:hypothetical protein